MPLLLLRSSKNNHSKENLVTILRLSSLFSYNSFPINQLVRDTERDPFNGIGKPEPLKGDLSGFWSRRIDDTNRLVYRINGDLLEILSCKGHYE